MANNDPITGLGGQDVAAERARRDLEAAQKAGANRDARITQRKEVKKYGKPTVRATINGPHSVQCRGDSLVIHINQPPGPAGGSDEGEADGTLLEDVVYLDTADDTLYYTNLFTDGRKEAV